MVIIDLNEQQFGIYHDVSSGIDLSGLLDENEPLVIPDDFIIYDKVFNIKADVYNKEVVLYSYQIRDSIHFKLGDIPPSLDSNYDNSGYLVVLRLDLATGIVEPLVTPDFGVDDVINVYKVAFMLANDIAAGSLLTNKILNVEGNINELNSLVEGIQDDITALVTMDNNIKSALGGIYQNSGWKSVEIERLSNWINVEGEGVKYDVSTLKNVILNMEYDSIRGWYSKWIDAINSTSILDIYQDSNDIYHSRTIDNITGSNILDLYTKTVEGNTFVASKTIDDIAALINTNIEAIETLTEAMALAGMVDKVNNISPDTNKNIDTIHPNILTPAEYSAILADSTLYDSNRVYIVEEDIEDLGNTMKPYMVVPDYSNRESTNRISSTSGGSWTADRNGYVHLICNVSADTGSVWFTLGGLNIYVDTWYGIIIYPISKGQTVSIPSQSSTIKTIGCYFIPPKIVYLD